MTPKIVTSIPELVAAVCERRDELGLTNATIDHVAGLTDRYASKLLGPARVKNFGEMSLRSVLDALALGVAVVVLTEDPEQAARMSKRWVKRKRQQRLLPAAPLIGCVVQPASLCNSSIIKRRRPMKLEQVQVRLDKDLRDKLQRQADADQRPLAQLIRKILTDAMQSTANAQKQAA